MRRSLLAIILVTATLSAAAAGASFDSTPPAGNPSGTTSFPFKFRSNGPPENSAVAYKIPGGTWKRCVVPNVVSLDLGPLADGIYTMAIADDISITYWASIGQLYSSHTAPCSTTDEPTTVVSTYTFTVALPVLPPAPPVTPVPAPPVTPTDPAPPSPAPVASTPPPNCKTLRLAYQRAKTSEHKALKAYHLHRTKARRFVYLKAHSKADVARRRYLRSC